jgi:hypothetical protein
MSGIFAQGYSTNGVESNKISEGWKCFRKADLMVVSAAEDGGLSKF